MHKSILSSLMAKVKMPMVSYMKEKIKVFS